MANDFDDLEERILEEISFKITNQLEDNLRNAKNQVIEEVRIMFEDALKNSPEYLELTGNTRTYHEFGIPDIKRRLGVIINQLLRNVTFEYNLQDRPRARTRAYFDFRITILGVSYDRIFNYATAVFETEKGEDLPWLEWLLKDGTSTVVFDGFYINRYTKASRTRLGFMATNTASMGWSVPSTIAGEIGDNWLTRAAASIAPKVERLVRRILRENLG